MIEINKSNFYYFISEIRYRIIYIIISSSFLMIMIYMYKEELVEVLTSFLNGFTVQYMYTRPQEIFFFYAKVLFLCFLFNFLIMSIANILIFISSALYLYEYMLLMRNLTFFIAYSVVLSILIAQHLIPLLLVYLMNISSQISNIYLVYNVKLTELMEFIVISCYILYIVFLLPYLVVFVLLKLNISERTIHAYRKYIYLLLLILSSLFSPGDWSIQIILYLLFILMVEFSILVYIMIKQ